MSRTVAVVEESLNMSLEELIPAYAFNKRELDSYKKICEQFNTEIKSTMANSNLTEFTAGGYVAKRVVTKKESFNEPKLIQVLKDNGLTGAIKTVEVVDYDALEQYLYSETPTIELASAIESCKDTSTVIQLRLSKAKKTKED